MIQFFKAFYVKTINNLMVNIMHNMNEKELLEKPETILKQQNFLNSLLHKVFSILENEINDVFIFLQRDEDRDDVILKNKIKSYLIEKNINNIVDLNEIWHKNHLKEIQEIIDICYFDIFPDSKENNLFLIKDLFCDYCNEINIFEYHLVFDNFKNTMCFYEQI